MTEYTKEQINKIVSKYTLNQKEYDNVLRTVIEVMSADKVPSDNPLAIIVGGQSGAGKTALINFTTRISTNREFVIIDNDFFRAFHPHAADIKKFHPGLYTHITDQIGLGFTSDVVSFFMGNDVTLSSGDVIENNNHVKYDLIFHQTLKSTRIADDAMAKLRDCGYKVGVRAFAVPYFESKMSQMERCKAQYMKMGFCRHVRPEDHFAALLGIPDTVNYIEQNNKADFIEIFKRSYDIKTPSLVYAKFNEKTKEETLKTLEDCESASHEDKTSGFSCAKEAIIKTWEQEAKRCSQSLQCRIDELKSDGGEDIPGMKEHIVELEESYKEYLETKEVCPPSER